MDGSYQVEPGMVRLARQRSPLTVPDMDARTALPFRPCIEAGFLGASAATILQPRRRSVRILRQFGWRRQHLQAARSIYARTTAVANCGGQDLTPFHEALTLAFDEATVIGDLYLRRSLAPAAVVAWHNQFAD
jgi:hypothetical protein